MSYMRLIHSHLNSISVKLFKANIDNQLQRFKIPLDC